MENCRHAGCACHAREGDDYCSDYCKDHGEHLDGESHLCACGHASCPGSTPPM
jgi:hypothetical protein